MMPRHLFKSQNGPEQIEIRSEMTLSKVSRIKVIQLQFVHIDLAITFGNLMHMVQRSLVNSRAKSIWV